MFTVSTGLLHHCGDDEAVPNRTSAWVNLDAGAHGPTTSRDPWDCMSKCLHLKRSDGASCHSGASNVNCCDYHLVRNVICFVVRSFVIGFGDPFHLATGDGRMWFRSRRYPFWSFEFTGLDLVSFSKVDRL